MAFVIVGGCIDIMDRSCVDECPVDCIYEGHRKLYINPAECIDCGACEPACPQDAIVADHWAAGDEIAFVDGDRAFFEQPRPDGSGPLGEPGGAQGVGVVPMDSPLVTAWPAQTGGEPGVPRPQ